MTCVQDHLRPLLRTLQCAIEPKFRATSLQCMPDKSCGTFRSCTACFWQGPWQCMAPHMCSEATGLPKIETTVGLPLDLVRHTSTCKQDPCVLRSALHLRVRSAVITLQSQQVLL